MIDLVFPKMLKFVMYVNSVREFGMGISFHIRFSRNMVGWERDKWRELKKVKHGCKEKYEHKR